MSDQSLRTDFERSSRLYADVLVSIGASSNDQTLNVSSVATGDGRKYGGAGKNAAVDVSGTHRPNGVTDRFYDKHEYKELSHESRNWLRLKRLKDHSSNGGGEPASKRARTNAATNTTLNKLSRSVAALTSKSAKQQISDPEDENMKDSDDESDDGNCTNAALTRQKKKKK